MPTIEIRPSTLQAVLTGVCQVAALWALLISAAPMPVRLGLGLGVLLQIVSSTATGLRRRANGGRQSRTQQLGLGVAYCRLGSYKGRVELQPPQIRYCSEWLIILEFRPRSGASVGYCHKSLRLVLWPDSLDPGDDWRLRRYLQIIAANPGPAPLSSGVG